MITPRTLKGFRDFLPKEARKRQYVIETLRNVFSSFGFEPLETPVLEYEEILAGKYGDEGDKLMYRFEDNGGRKVAMRYDQTVPLARVVAQFQNELSFPFKRYQIQPVWRAENTQKGRFREFLQCDIDTVGTASNAADAEIIVVVAKSLEKLGFKNFKFLINNRKVFSEMSNQAVLVIDKLKKIGREGVIDELVEKKLYDKNGASKILDQLVNTKPSSDLESIVQLAKKLGVQESALQTEPTLARGLDYYTGLIFEVEIEGYSAGSVCGGGRYDNLIGMFAGRQVPAVGCAFGFDRIVEAMNEMNLFPANLATTQVLVTIFSKELADESLKICSQLRLNSINTEIYLDAEAKMEKQFKYADQKGIPYVVIIGPDEVKNKTVQLKNLATREQKTVSLKDLPNAIITS